MPDVTVGLERARAVAPDVIATLEQADAAAAHAIDPALLTLCRRRLAMLLGAELPVTSDPKLLAISSWPTSPLFDDVDRACLAFTEQFVIDVASTTDAQAAAVEALIGPAALYGLANALYVVDQVERLQLTLAAALPAPTSQEALS